MKTKMNFLSKLRLAWFAKPFTAKEAIKVMSAAVEPVVKRYFEEREKQ